MAKIDYEALSKDIIQYFLDNKKEEYIQELIKNNVCSIGGTLLKRRILPGSGTEYEIACPYCGTVHKGRGHYIPGHITCTGCNHSFNASAKEEIDQTGIVFFKYGEGVVALSIYFTAKAEKDANNVFTGFSETHIHKKNFAYIKNSGEIIKFEREHDYYRKTTRMMSKLLASYWDVKSVFLDGITEVLSVSYNGRTNQTFLENIDKKATAIKNQGKVVKTTAPKKAVSFTFDELPLDKLTEFLITPNSIDELNNRMKCQVWCSCGHIWEDEYQYKEMQNKHGYTEPMYEIICPQCGCVHLVPERQTRYSQSQNKNIIHVVDNPAEDAWDIIYVSYYINAEWDVTSSATKAARVYKKTGKIEKYMSNSNGGWAKTQRQDKYTSYEDIVTPDSLKYSGLTEAFNTMKKGYYGFAPFTTVPKYLSLWSSYPILEQVVKRNEKLTSLVWTLCGNSDKVVEVNLEAKNTAEFFHIPERLLKVYCKPEYTMSMTSLQLLYKTDNNISEESVSWINKNSVSVERIITLYSHGISISDITAYLERVRKVQYVEPYSAIGEWADYLTACEAIGTDLSDKTVKYPRHLLSEHNIVINKRKLIDDTNKDEAFKNRCDKYAKLFNYKDKNIIVKAPESIQELLEEGRKLHHCVGSYADRIIDGSSIIFFIRRAKEPDTPWLTVDLNEGGQILELKGNFDRVASNSDKKLLQDWAQKKHLFTGKWL